MTQLGSIATAPHPLTSFGQAVHFGHPPVPGTPGSIGASPAPLGDSTNLSGVASQLQTLGTMQGAWLSSAGGFPDFNSIESVQMSVDMQRNIGAHLAEERDPDATIAVIDSFALPGQAPEHGDGMEAVLRSQGFRDENIQRYQENASGMVGLRVAGILSHQNLPIGERIDGHIEEYQTSYINRSAATLTGIANDPHNIRVISESRGTSRSNGLFALEQSAFITDADGNKSLTPEGREMMTHFGLEPGTDEETTRRFRQALVDRIDTVVSGSQRIQDAQAHFSGVVDRLASQGISYVTAAGNDGHEMEEMRRDGIRVPETWDDSLTSPASALVVGASDTRDSDPSKHQQAYFSSRYDTVDVLAPGVQIAATDIYGNGPRSGTSASAPHAAGRLETLRQENPTLSPQQLQSLLVNSGQQLPGADVLAVY